VTSLLTMSKPVGLFIQPLTEITRNEPVTPLITIGIPTRKWARSESLSHP